MSKNFRTIDEADVAGKRVLVRVDLNVPMENGKVSDTTRIDRILPTITDLAEAGAKVILLAHFGRPKNGPDEENSLRPLAAALSGAMEGQVDFAADCVGEVAESAIKLMSDGDILLLENTRFHAGEEKNDPSFVDALAQLGDLYVNDAFSAAHRAHASTEGIAHKLPAYAGLTMQAELEAIGAALDNPARPVAAIVGGAKVSTKLELLGNLSKKVDYLIIGGGMANTFLAAQGKAIGKSLCEMDLLDTARTIIADAKQNGCTIILPVDTVVAQKFEAHAPNRIAGLDDIQAEDMILDIGPSSVTEVENLLGSIKTLVWNGPFGAFEMEPFNAGTNAVANLAGKMTTEGQLLTVAGGGDTVAALNQAGAAEQFTYISTAGGAFLEWLEGKTLPGVAALKP